MATERPCRATSACSANRMVFTNVNATTIRSANEVAVLLMAAGAAVAFETLSLSADAGERLTDVPSARNGETATPGSNEGSAPGDDTARAASTSYQYSAARPVMLRSSRTASSQLADS